MVLYTPGYHLLLSLIYGSFAYYKCIDPVPFWILRPSFAFMDPPPILRLYGSFVY